MGLFDRNDYGRDYRGGRSLGDRMRGAWNRFEHSLGGAGRQDYDRDLRYGAGPRGGWQGEHRGYDAGDFAYRGMDGAWSTAFNRGAHDSQWDWRAAGGNRYDQDLGPRGGWTGQERGGRHDYDRGFFGGRGMEYDRGYRGHGGYDRDLGRDRMRTDAGDPFGDRQNRTPFRVLRGGFDAERTDRGGWYRGDRMGGGDPNGVQARGWNRGIGDDPVYRPEDFRDRGRGRGGPF